MQDKVNRRTRRNRAITSLATSAIIGIAGVLTGIDALYIGATGFAVGTFIILVLPFRTQGE